MKTFVFFFCVLCILGNIKIAVHGNKTEEGYAAGLLPNCPGSMKPAIIAKNHLSYLRIYVSGAKARIRLKKYTYYTVKDIANDPMMDWTKPTILFIPGYLDHIRTPVAQSLSILYKRIGYNVWLLDMFELMFNEYPVQVRAMNPIGYHIAEMIHIVATAQPKFDIKTLNLLGLSLGGQTISFVAKGYQNITGTKLQRITALDPAGPCFRSRGPEGRLDKSDADFVDIVYTNMGNAAMSVPAGHVNYYVNGGEFQPGGFYWLACNAICSHIRSYTLWVSALLSPRSFIAIKCDSVQDARDSNCYDTKPMVTNLLGPNVDKNKTGIFYLATRNRFPYYMEKNGLKKENNYIIAKTTKLNSRDILIL